VAVSTITVGKDWVAVASPCGWPVLVGMTVSIWLIWVCISSADSVGVSAFPAGGCAGVLRAGRLHAASATSRSKLIQGTNFLITNSLALLRKIFYHKRVIKVDHLCS
jgi:hypothetical protein